MPYQPIPFEIIVRGEMNILPSIESMPMPFDEISESFGMTQTPGMPGVRKSLRRLRHWLLNNEFDIEVRQPLDT
ncbi:uncharacterized protein EAE98_011496 [Botrytis deweyae]|uniref:Uncharacterized protein n=1 Tax=Botrytis deweyae TaxID=2478750 RepID=A0ABQ7I5M4_9HELO|nr:uncharacterized protein EAE98_011496 [Botrytis deweyae]KAF7909235.1 hypothetical protein EAE99_011450 [Botrytis elliptica]KAF7913471.1 hypothetical protein EAE98_011496 [Botrytis deweyae]